MVNLHGLIIIATNEMMIHMKVNTRFVIVQYHDLISKNLSLLFTRTF